MRSLGRRAVRAPRLVLVGIVLVAVFAITVDFGTSDRLTFGAEDFVSQGTESERAGHELEGSPKLGAFPEVAVILSADPAIENPALREFDKLATLLPRYEVSRDKSETLVLGYFRRSLQPGAAALALDERLRRFDGVLVGGPVLARQQVSDRIREDLLTAELIAFPLLLLLALWIFRSVVCALLPVLIGGLTLAVALLCLRPIAQIHPLSLFSINLVTGAALGLSLDYSLLLVSRYREERDAGLGTSAAAERTIATAGRTVMFSSTTVAAAFAVLFVFPVNFLRSVAIGGVLVALLAGAISLVALPALFAILGSRIEAGTIPGRRRDVRHGDLHAGGWYRWARLVMRRPVLIAAAAAAVIALFAAPAFGVRLSGLDPTGLPVSPRVEQFERKLERDFPRSPLNAIVVLAHGTRQAITGGVVRPLERLPDVAYGAYSRLGRREWKIQVNPKAGTFAPETTRIVDSIRRLPDQRLSVAGTTASFVDTLATLRALLPWALGLLATVTLTLLYVATRSVILPPKTFVMNVLSLAAALGLLVFFFHGKRLLPGGEHGALPLMEPIVIGISVFGILTDYGLFLLTRIREGWSAGLSNREAVAVGLERTGRLVSAAAILFCVAVGALSISSVPFVKEAAFGIAAAVAIDASLVRAGLVPSLMVLLGRWNWWRPAWLERRPR